MVSTTRTPAARKRSVAGWTAAGSMPGQYRSTR